MFMMFFCAQLHGNAGKTAVKVSSLSLRCSRAPPSSEGAFGTLSRLRKQFPRQGALSHKRYIQVLRNALRQVPADDADVLLDPLGVGEVVVVGGLDQHGGRLGAPELGK